MPKNAADYFARLQQKSRPKDATHQPLHSFMDLFLTDKRAENRSHSYLREVRRTFTAFAEFLQDALGHEPALADFTLDAARAYALYEQERPKVLPHPQLGLREASTGLSTITVRKNLRMLKVFASWLEREEWTKDAAGVPTNLLRRLELPKAEQKEIQPLTVEEEARLARACDDRTAPGCRRLALLLLYLDSGARLSEIAGLRISDVDLTRGLVHISWEHAKGRKARTVSFGAKTERALKRYGMIFRDPPITEAQPADPFFLTAYGEALTKGAIYQTFKRLTKRTGITRLHPHLLRHTTGTREIERGKSTREVQHRLGHASIMTTQRYTHIAEREIANRKRDSHVDELPITVRRRREDR